MSLAQGAVVLLHVKQLVLQLVFLFILTTPTLLRRRASALSPLRMSDLVPKKSYLGS